VVVLHALVPIKPEARERWLSIVDAVAKPSRAEEACRGYRIYEDIETPNSFIFVEEWEDLDVWGAQSRSGGVVVFVD
jgi:quinol monooxygenase YgiN